MERQQPLLTLASILLQDSTLLQLLKQLELTVQMGSGLSKATTLLPAKIVLKVISVQVELRPSVQAANGVQLDRAQKQLAPLAKTAQLRGLDWFFLALQDPFVLEALWLTLRLENGLLNLNLLHLLPAVPDSSVLMEQRVLTTSLALLIPTLGLEQPLARNVALEITAL